jgi:hypothetical protein
MGQGMVTLFINDKPIQAIYKETPQIRRGFGIRFIYMQAEMQCIVSLQVII